MFYFNRCCYPYRRCCYNYCNPIQRGLNLTRDIAIAGLIGNILLRSGTCNRRFFW